MSNNWTVRSEPFGVWEAELPLGDAEAAERWRQRANALGNDTSIFIATESARGLRAPHATTASYFDRGLELAERTAPDWDQLVAGQRPGDDELENLPLLRIQGPDAGEEIDDDEEVHFVVKLHSDIWFPFVQGFPVDDGAAWDNRELAQRHTPRLNRFLEGLAQCTRELGGTWRLRPDGLAPDYLVQLAHHGVKLDGPSTGAPWPHWVAHYRWGEPPRPLNLWCTQKDAVAAWHVRLPLSDLAELETWLEAVIDAGERHEVYRVQRAQLAHYERAQHGPLAAWLRTRFEATGCVDLFGFANDSDLEVETRLAYFDADGAIAEASEARWGPFLRKLRPYACADDIANARVLVVSGCTATGEHLGQDREVDVSIELYSDVWMPWVRGYLDRPEDRQLLDNRALAAAHTPRLNRFLTEVRDATRAVGGVFELTHADIPALVSEDGVAVDAERPRMPRSIPTD